MNNIQLHDEKYLEELFLAGKFPTIQEMLDNTKLLEQGREVSIDALRIWRRRLYKKFHLRADRMRKVRFDLTFTKEQADQIIERAEHFSMGVHEYIRYTALSFPLDHSPTLCLEDIIACKTLLLDHYNILKKLSRDPQVYECSGYGDLAELIVSIKEKFDALTNQSSKVSG